MPKFYLLSILTISWNHELYHFTLVLNSNSNENGVKLIVTSATELELEEKEAPPDVEKKNNLKVINEIPQETEIDGDSKSIKSEHHLATEKELQELDTTQRRFSIASVMDGPIILSNEIQLTENGKW